MLKVISGAQTGADRGALEAALALGTEWGGWVPKGRKAEDGVVPEKFTALREMQSQDYKRRTWANVRDSQGTVIICTQPPSGGSELTIRYCHDQDRKLLVRDAKVVIADPFAAAGQLWTWLSENEIKVLNVAGSRESRCPGLQAAVGVMIKNVLVRGIL